MTRLRSNILWTWEPPGAGKDCYMLMFFNKTDRSNYATVTATGSQATDLPTINANQQKDATQGIATSVGQALSRISAVVALPQPVLVDSLNIDWSQSELGSGEDLFSGQKSVTDVLKSVGIGGLRNAGNQLGGTRIRLPKGMSTSLNDLDLGALNNTASFVSRMSINSHAELLFNAIAPRSFTFQWKMVPQSQAEAENVYNICQAIKFYSVPEINIGTAGRVWLYPYSLDVQFINNGGGEYRSS